MSMAQFSDKRHKTTASISIDKYLLDRADELVKAGDFGSTSGVISNALSEFFANYDMRKKSRAQKPELTKPVVIE